MGLWAEESRQDAVDAVNQAATAAIAEIQNASTEEVAKPIQEQAIADINEAKDAAVWEIGTTPDEFAIDAVKVSAIYQINDIKAQALRDISAAVEQLTALPEVLGQRNKDKGQKIMHNGQLYIRKDGKMYNVFGTQIK